MQLEGRVALVTGASRGVGRAISLELARRGADVILAARTVNVTAPFILARALVPTMRTNGGGVIANVTSGAGITAEYTVPGLVYGSTKAALNRLTTLLARDLAGDGISVFALDPAYTRTVLVERLGARPARRARPRPVGTQTSTSADQGRRGE